MSMGLALSRKKKNSQHGAVGADRRLREAQKEAIPTDQFLRKSMSDRAEPM